MSENSLPRRLGMRCEKSRSCSPELIILSNRAILADHGGSGERYGNRSYPRRRRHRHPRPGWTTITVLYASRRRELLHRAEEAACRGTPPLASRPMPRMDSLPPQGDGGSRAAASRDCSCRGHGRNWRLPAQDRRTASGRFCLGRGCALRTAADGNVASGCWTPGCLDSLAICWVSCPASRMPCKHWHGSNPRLTVRS